MKSNLTNVKKRRFFQMEIDAGFREQLIALASLDGVSLSDVLRILVHREYAVRCNGHKLDPCEEEK
jgi:hypothetical protein